MAYNIKLADRIREYLAAIPNAEIEEKKMFRGLTFMVNGKMCISVSNDNLMCRFDPSMQDEVAEKEGFEQMIMNGKAYKGFCYVRPDGYKTKKTFEYWVELCLAVNDKARRSKKR